MARSLDLCFGRRFGMKWKLRLIALGLCTVSLLFDKTIMNLNVYSKIIQLILLKQSGDYNRSFHVECSMWNNHIGFRTK